MLLKNSHECFAKKVFNAKDGAAKLGLDAEGINAEWSKLTRGKDLIKVCKTVERTDDENLIRTHYFYRILILENNISIFFFSLVAVSIVGK